MWCPDGNCQQRQPTSALVKHTLRLEDGEEIVMAVTDKLTRIY